MRRDSAGDAFESPTVRYNPTTVSYFESDSYSVDLHDLRHIINSAPFLPQNAIDKNGNNKKGTGEMNPRPRTLSEFRASLVLNLRGGSGIPAHHWMEYEEVILQGIVTDAHLFFGPHVSWEKIACWFQTAVTEFARANLFSKEPRKRTDLALKRHYKTMHDKIGSHEVQEDFWYEVYHQIWNTEFFNKDQRIISIASRECL